VPSTTSAAPARRRALVVLTVLVAVLGGLLVIAPAASAYPGAPWFKPDTAYTENFPDPTIMVQGGEYHAYATATGGAYLPVMRSTDLRTWVARPAYDPPINSDPYYNDALPNPAPWAPNVNSSKMPKEVWAPGVEKIGPHYVAFYTVRTRISPARWCISYATSSSPFGPFVDRTSGPFVCDADPAGSIDPEPFVDPATGTPYLIWKSEGVPGSQPTKIWIRQLTADGTAFAPGSVGRELLRTSQGWEGNVIESPSMVRHNGQLYLFYSGNEWESSAYATSYAVCDSVNGPCHKPRSTPLLASAGDRLGPGAPSAFVDAAGRLQLAYHYWNAPYTSYPAYPECQASKTCTTQGQRRMAVTELSGSGGGLAVGAAPPPRPTPVAKTTEQACPSGVPEDGFSDVPEGSVHESAVDCLAWWKVTAGNGGRYHPDAAVTRGQMATFVARAILHSGGTLPDGGDAFRDDDRSVHQESIDRLAAAGIVSGTGKNRYSPDAPVTRAQMATFLLRAVKHRTGRDLTSRTDWFWDDEGNVHQAAINAVAEAGLATGTGGAAYSPEAPVRRDQMASFLTRTLEVYVENGARTP
jgi:hypothetical protein